MKTLSEDRYKWLNSSFTRQAGAGGMQKPQFQRHVTHATVHAYLMITHFDSCKINPI